MNDKMTTKIIVKINRDTKEGKIKWETISLTPSSLIGNEKLLGNVYTTKVLDKKIRLYKYQAKHYFDEEAYEWNEFYRLEFIDERGSTEYTIPSDSSILDLYETVMYKSSNIEGFA